MLDRLPDAKGSRTVAELPEWLSASASRDHDWAEFPLFLNMLIDSSGMVAGFDAGRACRRRASHKGRIVAKIIIGPVAV
jgi:hypothetical protein